VSRTSESLLLAISEALAKRDMEGVAALLHILAIESPHDAQAIVDALAIAKAADQ